MRKITANKSTAKRVVAATTTKPQSRGAGAKAGGAQARAMAATTEPKEGKFHPKVSYTPAEAKKWLLDICSDVTRDGEKRAYVEDRQGDRVVTLDPINRHLRGPVLDLSIQRFKDQFSRFCALIRIGACFRLTRRGDARPIYARRHTEYSDPLDATVERWLEGMLKKRVGRLAEAVERLADRDAQRDREVARLGMDVEDVKEAQQRDHKGILRIASNFPPFAEDPTQPHARPLGLGEAGGGDAAPNLTRGTG